MDAEARRERGGQTCLHQQPTVAATVEVVRNTYACMPAALAGYMAGCGVVAVLYWSIAPAALMRVWIGAFALMCLVRGVLVRCFQRAQPATREEWLAWRRRSGVATVVGAALWGATGWVFYGLGNDPPQAAGLIVIIYAFSVAGIPVLAMQPRLYRVYAGLCLLPLVVRIASHGDPHSLELAGELLLIVGLTALLARSYRGAFQRAIDLKLQADALAGKLRDETRAAESAREEAERANRAKSRFFAAASHDLRQPLHAMGLLVQALHQRVDEPALAQLVDGIDQSVGALDDLFSELLDLARIDSGVIEVRPRPFQVEEVLRKLRLHFEPSAFEKGLSLRMRGGSKVVFADPLLLERILRNLVSNAIRYTARGTVLVSCRGRGDHVLIQVWDTGRGIPEPDQRQVFAEFCRGSVASETDPGGSPGCGLGLAIVKRMAGLMQAPLALRSVPGHGTVLTLQLPGGRSALAPSSADPERPLAINLTSRRIVLIENEPAVRANLQRLLAGWGAHTDAFESAAASRAWAKSDPPPGRPDLLIVDHPAEGRAGVDAVRGLRARFGAPIPAILVTGGTATAKARQLDEPNLHVLLKPVMPCKLRAMIAFKLSGTEHRRGTQVGGARQ